MRDIWIRRYIKSIDFSFESSFESSDTFDILLRIFPLVRTLVNRWKNYNLRELDGLLLK